MARGRKPKPTALKVVQGTARPDRTNAAEPKVKVSIPKAPAHISAPARKEWDRVCADLAGAGILSSLDRGALAAYCQAYGRWVDAERALAKIAEADPETMGLVTITASGNAIQNPLVGAANKAMADMVRYAAEFGMTPSARSRITAIDSADDDDPFAAFA